MGLLSVKDVTHWSIAVNNLEESEEFYGEFLGLEHVGRLGNSRMTCFKAGEHRILLAERKNPQDAAAQSEEPVHHSFTVSPRFHLFQVGLVLHLVKKENVHIFNSV